MRDCTVILACTLVLITGPVVAEDVNNKVTISVPLNKKFGGPMAVSSDSKMIQELLRKHNTSKQQNKFKAGAPRQFSGVKHNAANKARKTGNAQPEEPTIIQLNNSESQAAVVNKSKQFVFSDITSRHADVAGRQNDLAERSRAIELLRQAAARR